MVARLDRRTAHGTLLGVLEQKLEDAELAETMSTLHGNWLNELTQANTARDVIIQHLFDLPLDLLLNNRCLRVSLIYLAFCGSFFCHSLLLLHVNPRLICQVCNSLRLLDFSHFVALMFLLFLIPSGTFIFFDNGGQADFRTISIEVALVVQMVVLLI